MATREKAQHQAATARLLAAFPGADVALDVYDFGFPEQDPSATFTVLGQRTPRLLTALTLAGLDRRARWSQSATSSPTGYVVVTDSAHLNRMRPGVRLTTHISGYTIFAAGDRVLFPLLTPSTYLLGVLRQMLDGTAQPTWFLAPVCCMCGDWVTLYDYDGVAWCASHQRLANRHVDAASHGRIARLYLRTDGTFKPDDHPAPISSTRPNRARAKAMMLAARAGKGK